MVAPSFSDAKVMQFAKTVTEQVSQTESFLKPYVDFETVTGDFFEIQTVGSLNAKYKTEYNQNIEYGDVTHAKRGKSMQTPYLPVKIDKQQITETLLDIDSWYTKEIIAGMQREIDNIIISGGLGSYWTGNKFQTQVNWSDVTSGATQNTFDFSGAAFSYASCITLGNYFMSKGYGLLKGSEIYLTITEKQASDLITEANSAKKERYDVMFVNGVPTKVGMINLIIVPSSPEKGPGLLKVESSKRVGIAFVRGGIKMGISKDVTFEVERLTNTVESYHLLSVARMDALRVTDAQVIKVLMQP